MNARPLAAIASVRVANAPAQRASSTLRCGNALAHGLARRRARMAAGDRRGGRAGSKALALQGPGRLSIGSASAQLPRRVGSRQGFAQSLEKPWTRPLLGSHGQRVLVGHLGVDEGKPHGAMRSARATSATFEALDRCANMDSPKNIRPNDTP